MEHCLEIVVLDINECRYLTYHFSRFELAEEKLGSTLNDKPSNVEEILPQDSGTNHSSLQPEMIPRETPIGTRNSLDDPESDPSRVPVLQTCHESLGKKSQSSSGGGLTEENLSGQSTRALLDLSVPPPGRDNIILYLKILNSVQVLVVSYAFL